MTERFSRRSFLYSTAAASGLALLAGCSGSSGSNGGDGGGGGETAAASTSGGETRSFDGWFDRTANYDGVHDETGRDTVTVDVGASGNGGGFAFEPAAVSVSPGTTVVWEWTGNGGVHNVSDFDGAFESELTAEAGFTFEQTFDDPGEVKYLCVPHETLGMVGVVVVE